MTVRKQFLEKLATLSMFAAISIVLVSLIRVPMFLPFLEYDPADIPILISGILYGPAAGLIITVVVSAMQTLIFSSLSGIIGFIMHVIATGGMVVICSLIFRATDGQSRKTTMRLGTALITGSIFMILVMVPMNLLLTPIYAKMSASDIWEQFMFVGIVPFNVVKAVINSVATLLLYPIICRAIPGKIFYKG